MIGLKKHLLSKYIIIVFGNDPNQANVSITIFRVLQELTSNSLKHSKAKNIRINVNSFEDLINIVFEDDGVGFSPKEVKHGLGLTNIESRIHAVNGTISFESSNVGVSYSIDIPLLTNNSSDQSNNNG